MSLQFDLIKQLIANKNYNALNAFKDIEYPDKDNLIVTEYAGADIRIRKSHDGIQIFCPNNMTMIQESALTKAIANGTIFDDANEVQNVAHHIVATAAPMTALANTGKLLPENTEKVTAIVVGKMDDDGRCNPSECPASVEDGQNFIKDLVDAKANNYNSTGVYNHYIDNENNSPNGIEMTKELIGVEEEVEDMKSVNPEDSISEDDYTELDPTSEEPSKDIHNSWNDDEDNDTDSDVDTEFSNDESEEYDDVEECGPVIGQNMTPVSPRNTVEECGDPKNVVTENEDDMAMADTSMDTSMNTTTTSSDMAMDTGSTDTGAMDTQPSTADQAVVTEDEENMSDTTTPDVNKYYVRPGGDTVSQHPVSECGENSPFSEGFFHKKPKKLKPIPRDIIAYITVEMNDIQDANDQAMLSGYTCSKIELVDFYLNCIDTNDERYIVPHTKQYLEQMQKELNSLLAQILRIRPINRSDRVWNVNYPT